MLPRFYSRGQVLHFDVLAWARGQMLKSKT
jgi:hypothetical protein